MLFDRSCRDNGIVHRLTRPASPTTTGKIERFHQTLRRDLLADHERFADLEDVQATLDHRVDQDYNTRRPHRSLDWPRRPIPLAHGSGRPRRRAVSDTTVGQRVAALRRARGMSQRELAVEMNRSESWVSQVECDVQPVERVGVLNDLAAALGVSIRELRPEALSEPDQAPAEPAVNDLDGVRLNLSGHPALSGLFAPEAGPLGDATLDELERQVDQVWDLAHTSRFAELSAALTDVLPPLEDAARSTDSDDERSRVHALRARVYQAVSAAFARQDEPDAAWVAADRAISAAELAGDRLDVIAGHFRLAHAFIRLRRYEQAEHVITTALHVLRPAAGEDTSTPELLSLYGAMHLVQAVVSGHEGDRARARTHLADAQAIAERIGEDRNDYDTAFGPTNVLLHTVAVDVDLGDAGEALDIARQVDATGLSPERQGRFLVDVARAHAQRRHVGEATAALIEADRLAPEHARTHHAARDCLADLLAQAGRRPPSDLLAPA